MVSLKKPILLILISIVLGTYLNHYPNTIPSAYFGDSVGYLVKQSNQSVHIYNIVPKALENLISPGALSFNFLCLFYTVLTLATFHTLKKLLSLGILPSTLLLLIIIAPLRIYYSMEWPNHANWAWIILYLYFLLKLLRNPLTKQYRTAFLVGLFFSASLLNNAYHGVELAFTSIILLAFFITNNLLKTKRTNLTMLFLNLAILGTLSLASVTFLYHSFSRNINITGEEHSSILEIATRSPEARWAFSARPWHYLIPDINHPILGNMAVKIHYRIWQHTPYYLTEPFFPKEHTLYIGYTLLSLSIYTLWQTYIKKRIKGETRFTVTFFTVIAITAFIFSMPPYMTFNGLKVYFPSYFIYPILPQFRAYARYGVMVSISSVILAAIGLDYIIRTLKNKSKPIKLKPLGRDKQLSYNKQQLIAFTIISALAIFEYLPSQQQISTLPLPPYIWLSSQDAKEIKYMEVPIRQDYTDRLYTYKTNLTSMNPYLRTPKDVGKIYKTLFNIQFAKPDSAWCEDFQKLGGRYIMYHKKDVIKGQYIDRFIETGEVTPQLKVALAESWGNPIWGNHAEKTEEEKFKNQRLKDMEKLLGNDPKFKLVAKFSNSEIIKSRPNKNFSADKFDEVLIFKINEDYCKSL